MQKTSTGYLLIPPLSKSGVGRLYREALPDPTAELCGKQGMCIAVGFSVQYMVYRVSFDERSGTGSWSYLYSWSDDVNDQIYL